MDSQVEIIYQNLNAICIEHEKYTDEELAEALRIAYKQFPSQFLINHNESNKLILDRVTTFCKKNKISLEEYEGPLPFRLYVLTKNPFEEVESVFIPQEIREELFKNKQKRFIKRL